MFGELITVELEIGAFAFRVGVLVDAFPVTTLLAVGEAKAAGCSDVLATGEAKVAGVINPPPSPDTGWKNKKAVNTLPAAAIKNIVRFIIS
jgi:hypothetical protein